ncbi:MAG: tRNA (adenosine(37)-N6)-threonylcarbamoyltransferase complex dimerization subunit type 1 TsaB [Gemmatimonadaceae bacterium]
MAGLTLAMDAAAGAGTIAVLRDGVVVAERTVAMRSGDDERFLPAVLETLGAADASVRAVARIVCGAGPGSFTALRVVGACAKGLAFGGGAPLCAVPSLALIVAGSDATRAAGSRWLATLDAMRGDRYLALVTIGPAGALATVESLGLAPATEVAARAAALQATPIGPGEDLDAAPHARGTARCAALIHAAGPVALGSWEPVYGRLAEAQVKWEAAQGRPLDR